MIEREARAQCLAQNGKLPRYLGSVRGAAQTRLVFHPSLADADVAMYGVEAGGKVEPVSMPHRSLPAHQVCYTEIAPI